MTDQGGHAGLAWPDHDSGPVPPPDHVAAGRDERPTRKPLAFWDRVKFLLLFVLLFWFFVWSNLSDNPIITTGDAFRDTVSSKWWLFALFGLEVVRQLHFLVAERSPGYHRFWSESVFGRFERRAGRLNDWNRYRIARALKVLAALALLSVVMGVLFDVHPATALFELPARLYTILPFVLQLAFGFFFVIFQFVGLFWFLSRGGVDVYFPDDIKTRFSDVWGQDAVVDRVKENMVFLEDPETIEAKGGYVPGGILLWGPPGTGKTLMAEAVAGETGKPFVFVDPGAFINMFMGVGILKVKGLFRKLRKLAVRYGGVIVFFDEADALGNRGLQTQPGFGAIAPKAAWDPAPACNGDAWLSPQAQWALHQAELPATAPPSGLSDRIIAGMGGMGGGGMGTLQALLTELSGLKKPRGFMNRVVRRVLGMRPKPPPKYRILVMMATNMPQALDEALLRPGRIDRIYKVGYPSKQGRKRTYEGYLAKVAHNLSDEEIDKLAVMTPYGTGATIKDMVNEALIIAIRDGRSTITWPDIVRAKQLKEHGPPDDAEYIERERHATAIHEACHAVVTYRTRRHVVIDMATIERRGDTGGFVAWIPPEDQMFNWRSEYEADLMSALASLAGERLFFEGDNTNGVGGDLAKSTRLATMMEGYWGMGSTIASHRVKRELGVGGGGGPRPDKPEDEQEDLISGPLGERIEGNLRRLFNATEQLLRDSRSDVLALAHALETYKTLSGEDVIAVLEGRQGPMIDGRPYKLPEFIELAERYHERALEAHRRHSAIDVPLPVYTPPAAVPVGAVAGNGGSPGPGPYVYEVPHHGGNGSRGNGR
ncbi:MAG TPA: AAA family ATPase [Acidimicrobiales bacterium]|jgi:ATP-dependent Zn protease